MDAIGGYFSLELKEGGHYHKNALKLNTARNAFEYILRCKRYKKAYIPYYTCDVMLQPLEKLGILYEFYEIDKNFEPKKLYKLNSNECFLYTNYYGLKQNCVERLAEIYGNRLIVDNAQAFFAPRIDGIDTFYSARKFLGVADGAYLYTDTFLNEDLEYDVSYERMSHLLKRIDNGAEAAYMNFRDNDDALDFEPIKKMSRLTSMLLEGVDYEYVKKKRVDNFLCFYENLQSKNELKLIKPNLEIPMVYPLLTTNNKLREYLIANKIFVATYWPNIKNWVHPQSIEYKYATLLLALPIDQRYSIKDMEYIIKTINKIL